MRRLAVALAWLAVSTSVASAKSGSTWHTLGEVVKVRERCQREDWAIEQREQAQADAARWIAMSDEELWAFILDADVPRALNTCFGVGCPECGPKVFQKGGHYPWIMSADEPFKATCPVCERGLPTNDVAAYLADFAPGYRVAFSPWLEVERAADGELICGSNAVFERK
ncbi:MAG TPA: hypothetical protein PLO37_11665 [Candidatus Hydrogenedentes bacterium]|nr:hypothetical protein [Candidatus Hydrogenedentota bacterium]HPG67498.1 hypothetical protein [Candidatus Hydrogenedentota bacterium]